MPEQVRKLLPNKVASAMVGVVPRTLFRYVDDPALDFPKPTIINNRRYFHEDDIIAWQKRQALASVKIMEASKRSALRRAGSDIKHEDEPGSNRAA